MRKSTNGYNRLTLAVFVALLRYIIEKVTGNAYFPTLQAEIAAIAADAEVFYDLVTKASRRDQDAIIARDNQRDKITTKLHYLGLGVTAIAKGDTDILASSGIPFSKVPERTAPIVKPGLPRITPGANSGTADSRTDWQPGMKVATYCISGEDTAVSDPENTNWTTGTGTTKFTFTNLIPGKRYYSRTIIEGVRGQQVFSDVVSFIAL